MSQRVIKFRAWHMNLLEMQHDVHLLDSFSEMLSRPETYHVMQFTGLLDKNGKEIYEGDLMKVLDRDWPSGEGDPAKHMDSISAICEVVFHNGCFMLIRRKGGTYFQWELASTYGRDIFSVISNIHQNPELLKL